MKIGMDWVGHSLVTWRLWAGFSRIQADRPYPIGLTSSLNVILVSADIVLATRVFALCGSMNVKKKQQ